MSELQLQMKHENPSSSLQSRVEPWRKWDSDEKKDHRRVAKSSSTQIMLESYSRKRCPSALCPAMGPVEKKRARKNYSHRPKYTSFPSLTDAKNAKARSVSDEDDDSSQQHPIVKFGVDGVATAPGDLVAYFAEIENRKEMKEAAKKDISPSADDKDSEKDLKNAFKTAVMPQTYDVIWFANLDDLKTYKQLHGDCFVPRYYKENPRLGNWVR
jgi:hypothetical protein